MYMKLIGYLEAYTRCGVQCSMLCVTSIALIDLVYTFCVCGKKSCNSAQLWLSIGICSKKVSATVVRSGVSICECDIGVRFYVRSEPTEHGVRIIMLLYDYIVIMVLTHKVAKSRHFIDC